MSVLLINKPTGWTSHDVVAQVRRQTGVKKVGHAGTLDPLATGLLIVLVGRSDTKRQSEFLKLDKTYTCRFRLGIETDTYDSDGTVIKETSWPVVKQVTQTALEAVLQSFQGEILQTVPAYSAIKRQGHKLYDLARSGQLDIATLPQRPVTITMLSLSSLRVDTEKEIVEAEVTVACSSGTYIRSLVHDIGVQLGTGAMVTALCRTQIGPYLLADAYPLDLHPKLR